MTEADIETYVEVRNLANAYTGFEVGLSFFLSETASWYRPVVWSQSSSVIRRNRLWWLQSTVNETTTLYVDAVKAMPERR